MPTKTNASLAALVAVFLTAAAGAEDSAQVEAGSDGFSLSSADDAWTLELHGLVHFDGRWFSGDSAADDADEWLLRRVRPSLEGALGERIEFRIMPDFGEGDAELVDAYVDTALGNGEAWQATAEWFLTGEEAGYRDPESAGAVQLVARIARLDIDEQAFAGGLSSFADPADAVRRADTWGAGVNWWPLQGLKASLVYQQTSCEGGAPAGGRPDEKVVLLRLQQTF